MQSSTICAAIVVILGCAAGGCAYDAKPISTGAVSVVGAYSTKVPGRFALVVEATELNKIIRPRGAQCAAHSYPLNMSEGFRSSVRATLTNMFEAIEEVSGPLAIDALRRAGFRGQIHVRGEGLEGKLVAIPGFWTANISTTIQLTASIVIDGLDGRLAGKTVEGIAERETEAGPLCSGGATSVEEAATQAMRKVITQIGEVAANSDRVRVAGQVR